MTMSDAVTDTEWSTYTTVIARNFNHKLGRGTGGAGPTLQPVY